MNKINFKLNRYGSSIFKLSVTGIALIVSVIALFEVIFGEEYHSTKNILCVLATIGLLFAPFIVGNLMKFSLNNGMYIFVTLYAIAGPLLGSVFLFYNRFFWWDELLHVAGGVVFAILGIFVAKLINRKNQNTLAMIAIFAFCFSITFAVLWEFYEYSLDVLFDFDMQRDTVIGTIVSQNFGTDMGKVGIVDGITSTIINRADGTTEIVEGGYLDIGLLDTMKDMAVEGLGALIYCIIFAIDRDKHPIITFLKKDKA